RRGPRVGAPRGRGALRTRRLGGRLPALAGGAGRHRLRRGPCPRGRSAPVVKTTDNPDALAHLEEEREFLLRSLRDLEREREAGDIEEGDYRTLRDDYTARAAAVLRSIDDGRAQLPARRARNVRRLVATVAVVVVVALGAGVLVARASGERVAG